MSTPNKKNLMGKGISALLGNIAEEIKQGEEVKLPSLDKEIAQTSSINEIELDKITTNPKQPRKDFDETALRELSESIALHGIIQPITVIKLENGKYQLISGERRWRASKLAGLKAVPAYIRTADNQAQIELALLENLQREDLNAIEIALSYKLLADECGFTQEEVAERMKKERSTVTNYMRLLKLPPTIQNSVRENKISMGHARAILSIQHIEQQLYAHREIMEKGLSVRATESLVKGMSDKPKSKNVNEPAALPPAFKRIEDQISSKLSTKVVLERKKNGKGSLMIPFISDADLERIMESLGV
jgi:ParB family transcriptional regulator, chromosome partitioning protein